jgi:hypothetical protein
MRTEHGLPDNPNGLLTEPRSPHKGRQYNEVLRLGQVVNVRRDCHITQRYDVQFYDFGEVRVAQCRVSTSIMSFEGVGEFQPLQEGQPVLVAFANGVLDRGIILGTFSTLGNYEDYYQGNLSEVGETYSGSFGAQTSFNRPSEHPSRITQGEEAYFHIVGGKSQRSFFSSPEFASNLSEEIDSRPLPVSIEIKNQSGDHVQYCHGSHVVYADGNVINISGGTAESKQVKLLRSAAKHAAKAELLSGIPLSIDNIEQLDQAVPEWVKQVNALENSNNSNSTAPTINLAFGEEETPLVVNRGVTPLIISTRNPEANLEVFEDSYRAREELKTALVYLESSRLTGNYLGSQQNAVSNLGQSPNPSTFGFNPVERNAPAHPNNFGERLQIPGVPNPERIAVLHETVGSIASTLSTFANPQSQVSYHSLVDLDGTIYHIVPWDKRAFGAGNSVFNGPNGPETFQTSSQLPPSVNNFAYHFSLVTPEDGRNNNATHSGYSDAQYQSLAWLVQRSGVPRSRVTTHAAVDRSGTRSDPRSFNIERLF